MMKIPIAELKDIEKASINGDEFEIGFMNFLHIQGYLGEDIFSERNRTKVEQYRAEFIKGYNYGYK